MTLRLLLFALTLVAASEAGAQQRLLRPDDLFRVERAGAITWSPSGTRATVELRRPGRWIDANIPTSQIGVVNATSGGLQVITPASPEFIGYFGAAWSPDGRRVAFLSLDTNGVVRPWVWTGVGAPRVLRSVTVRDALGDGPAVVWRDSVSIVLIAKEPSAPDEGPLYFRVTRGKNVADAWRVARAGRDAAVTVLEAGVPQTISAPALIVSIDVRTGTTTTLATGLVRRVRLSPDRRTITFRREQPARAADFFGPEAQGEEAYDLVNFGGSVHHIHSHTGAEATAPDTTRPPTPARTATLRSDVDQSTGSALTLVRPGKPDTVVWRGNAWMREIRVGKTESVQYKALDGSALTGWILYPPDYQPGKPVPAVTVVYPMTIYGPGVPPSLSLLFESFVHQQMFSALGYAVILPSMPDAEKPLQARSLDALTNGVLPLLDTLIRRGIVDSARIAVVGQSYGGYATLGLITRTNRFRTAIASASYSDLRSLYGTFYGQFRFGDQGHPLRAQLLRMLQVERGFMGAGAPPWENPERYLGNSSIADVRNVQTPLMLIHGESDFIPIQQAEEFFTALYRQDKRAVFVRYAGEGHTISARANVLDMWRRIEDWLRDTM